MKFPYHLSSGSLEAAGLSWASVAEQSMAELITNSRDDQFLGPGFAIWGRLHNWKKEAFCFFHKCLIVLKDEQFLESPLIIGMWYYEMITADLTESN